jgi:3-keto-L-gulonate-6-phosphate decarboxylase
LTIRYGDEIAGCVAGNSKVSVSGGVQTRLLPQIVYSTSLTSSVSYLMAAGSSLHKVKRPEREAERLRAYMEFL